MAKELTSTEKNKRKQDVAYELMERIEEIFKNEQDKIGITDGGCPPELTIDLDLAVDHVANTMCKILDLQTTENNKEQFYEVKFKYPVRGRSGAEVLEIVKEKINNAADISEILQFKELNLPGR